MGAEDFDAAGYAAMEAAMWGGQPAFGAMDPSQMVALMQLQAGQPAFAAGPPPGLPAAFAGLPPVVVGPRVLPKVAQPAVEDDSIVTACGTALKDVAHLETEWDFDTLKWRVSKHFRTAAKNMDWTGPYDKVINEYADVAFGSLMWALNGREWLMDADFTIVLEVAIHELFPAELRSNVPQVDLEEQILGAHDRAFEENRVAPALWESVREVVDGKKNQSKVHAAVEASRREACTCSGRALEFATEWMAEEEGPFWDKVREFIAGWVHGFAAHIYKVTDGYGTNLISEEAAVNLFERIFQGNALPRSLMLDLGEPLPEPWPFVKAVVSDAYTTYKALFPEEEPKAKKRKEPTEGYKEELCLYFQAGKCTFGSRCQSAHGESELRGRGLLKEQKQIKTELCRFFANGFCGFGSACLSAHGADELRDPRESAPQGWDCEPAAHRSGQGKYPEGGKLGGKPSAPGSASRGGKPSGSFKGKPSGGKPSGGDFSGGKHSGGKPYGGNPYMADRFPTYDDFGGADEDGYAARGVKGSKGGKGPSSAGHFESEAPGHMYKRSRANYGQP